MVDSTAGDRRRRVCCVHTEMIPRRSASTMDIWRNEANTMISLPPTAVNMTETLATGSDVGIAFALVTAAGLATVIGSCAVCFPCLVRATRLSFLSASLAFSAGIIVYVSFREILVKSVEEFQEAGSSEGLAELFAMLSFFGGILLMAILEVSIHSCGKAIPHMSASLFSWYKKSEREGVVANGDDPPDDTMQKNPKPHVERKNVGGSDDGTLVSETGDPIKLKNMENGLSDSAEHPSGVIEIEAVAKQPSKSLMNMGCMTAVSIALHNFPEGLATFVATLDSPSVGAALAVGIAIHNIPEGLAVAVPVYYSSGSRLRGFFLGAISGLSEPIGALIGWLVLFAILEPEMYALIFGLVAGMMIFICIHEILPTALEYSGNRPWLVTLWFTFGMFVMSLSLVLFSL